MKHLLDLQLWHLFKYAELPEIVRQNDKLFIDLFNKVRVNKIGYDEENLLKARHIYQYDEDYPKDALHMGEAAIKRNEIVLNDLPGGFCTIQADDKILDNCKYQH